MPRIVQGTLTYVGQPNSAGQVIIVLRIDLGYPVSTLLFSGATLLAIAFDPTSGLLTTNTRCVSPAASAVVSQAWLWVDCKHAVMGALFYRPPNSQPLVCRVPELQAQSLQATDGRLVFAAMCICPIHTTMLWMERGECLGCLSRASAACACAYGLHADPAQLQAHRPWQFDEAAAAAQVIVSVLPDVQPVQHPFWHPASSARAPVLSALTRHP